MAKVAIAVPDHFPFSTEVDVLISHINSGQHLANENLVAFLNEARVRFVKSLHIERFGYNPKAFINADLAVIYKAEAKYGDRLKIEVAAQDFFRYGCDYVYRVSRPADGRLIAIAKTAMMVFDYEKGQAQAVDEHFQKLFNQ